LGHWTVISGAPQSAVHSRCGKCNCLDLVSVGITDESGIIVGIIFRPQAWRTVSATAMRKRRMKEGVNGSAPFNFECNMDTIIGVMNTRFKNTKDGYI
jgi:hypothetical protein